MPLGPDELDDASWALVTKYLTAKAQTLKQTENEFLFQLLKLDWKVVTDADTSRMEDFVDRFELRNLEQKVASDDESRPVIDERIAELKAKTEPARE
jgi:hypothetical protein